MDEVAVERDRGKLVDHLPKADYAIRDLDSFQNVTDDPHQVARLYFFKKMDCLVTLAHKITYDFFQRPQLYTNLGIDIVNRKRPFSAIIAHLHYQYGVNEYLPSAEQREQIYAPILGSSAGEEDGFPGYRDDIIGAAAAFSERVYDTGEDMLRERVKNSHRIFQDYLIGFPGDTLDWGAGQALPSLTETVAYQVLRNPGVTAVFGIATPPGPDWPYREDPNGGKLVEAVSKQLGWPGDQNAPYISREQFSLIQRAALRGAEALAVILDYQESMDKASLDTLIRSCYAWGAALLRLDARAGGNGSGNGSGSQPSSTLTERTLIAGNTALIRPVNNKS